MKKSNLLLAFAFLMIPLTSRAAVTLLDKDDWKVQMSGFLETDFFSDTRRGFTEVIGNSAVARPGTFATSNGRMQTSMRNSRLAFSIVPPEQDGWKSQGYLEMDFLGFDPAPATPVANVPNNSEASYYANPTLRVRHAFLKAENDGWSILAGQYWTLFGWQPTYVLATASVPPGPGILYQRTPQLTGIKAIDLGSSKIEVAASIARPSQRDAALPNEEIGVKYSLLTLNSGFAAPSGDAKAMPLSVALSATARHFATANSATVSDGLRRETGSAFALNTMLPILPTGADKDPSNTLTLTMEYSTGTGYADEFPGWTGNLTQMPTGAGSSANTALDAGQGGYDGSGTYQLMKLESWSAQLQYHLPLKCHSFVTIGHSELSAAKMAGMTPASGSLYDHTAMDFVNYFHDFTGQIRGAVEYAKITTGYVDGVGINDERYEVNAYFRF